MAQIIKHIDQIGREQNRDVLYIEFDREIYSDYIYEQYEERNNLLKWLDDNDIPYVKCADYASENGWESYRGQLYIDVPMDKNNDKYKLLNEHLENNDGSFKIKGVNYIYLPLEIAMKNKHHDEPGFWDKWAEDF